VNFSRSTHRF